MYGRTCSSYATDLRDILQFPAEVKESSENADLIKSSKTEAIRTCFSHRGQSKRAVCLGIEAKAKDS